jgi:hypothetical protein
LIAITNGQKKGENSDGFTLYVEGICGSSCGVFRVCYSLSLLVNFKVYRNAIDTISFSTDSLSTVVFIFKSFRGNQLGRGVDWQRPAQSIPLAVKSNQLKWTSIRASDNKRVPMFSSNSERKKKTAAKSIDADSREVEISR